MRTSTNWLSAVLNCQIETSIQSRVGEERNHIDEISIVGFESDMNTHPIRSALLCESLLVPFQVTVILSHHSVSVSLSRGFVTYLNLELAIHEVVSESRLITILIPLRVVLYHQRPRTNRKTLRFHTPHPIIFMAISTTALGQM